MDVIIDKTLLLVVGFILLLSNTNVKNPVVAFLVAVTAAALGIYIEETKVFVLLLTAIFILIMIEPGILFFFAVFLYDMIDRKIYIAAFPFLVLLFFKLPQTPQQIAIWLFALLLAVILAVKTEERQSLRETLIRIRDHEEERNLILKEKNKNLLDKQDYEIHLATLRERNRIAREIHDNVGHLLSRALLMTGALLTTEREEALQKQLFGMKETLDLAMNSIRKSVHGLYDDSIDLKQSVEELMEPMKQKYEVKMEYDMSDDISSRVKYCLIATAKEAVSNILNHSNGDWVRMSLVEHPGFYQLLIEDNGTDIKNGQGNGMGLQNMKERTEALNGTFRVYTKEGFRIFVTIPKTEGNICGQ